MKVAKYVNEEKIKECSKTLIEFRQEHQYTQMEMSALLGLSQGTISNIELRKPPLSLKTYETVMEFCQNSDVVNALQVQCYKLIKHTLNKEDLKLIQAFIIALRVMKKSGGMQQSKLIIKQPSYLATLFFVYLKTQYTHIYIIIVNG